MEFLVATGFCIRKNDQFLMGTQKTHVESDSPNMIHHHTNWRIQAMAECKNLAKNELMLTAPISLSASDFENLREQMLKFIEDFLKTVHDSTAEDIACFNLDFFF